MDAWQLTIAKMSKTCERILSFMSVIWKHFSSQSQFNFELVLNITKECSIIEVWSGIWSLSIAEQVDVDPPIVSTSTKPIFSLLTVLWNMIVPSILCHSLEFWIVIPSVLTSAHWFYIYVVKYLFRISKGRFWGWYKSNFELIGLGHINL